MAINWNSIYTQGTYKSSFLGGGGKLLEFKSATLNLPKLISRIWTIKQVSELPMIKINDVDVDEIFNQAVLKDIAVPINKLLALGTIFVVPYVNTRNELTYETIAQDDNITALSHYSIDDELVFLKYTRSEKLFIDNEVVIKQVTTHHYMADNVYYCQRYYEENNKRYYLDDMDGKQPISNDKMLPFKVELRINADAYGLPIYANAVNLIEDCNKTYHEMINAMELLRPIVAIPQSLASSSERNNDDVAMISNYHRVFAIIPGMDASETDWKYFGGNFNPNGYIEALNNQLSDVSIQCGFGRKYLSYDKQDGMKTATEVIFSQNDMFVSQLMINQTMALLIKRLISSFYYLRFKTFNEEIDVVFEDSVYNSETEYFKCLEFDVMNGLISKEFYLKERYPNQNIEDIIAVDSYE